MRMILLALLVFLTGCGGAAGPKGDAGANGSGAGLIASGYSCNKISGGFSFHYNSDTYSNGDVWIECDVSGSAIQATNTKLYKASQVGASTFSCIVVLDSDGTASAGFWNFTGTSGTRKAVYNDAGSTIDQTTINFSSGDCVEF